MDFKNLLGTCASITTIGQFLAGMFTVRRLYNQGMVGDLSHVPFLMGAVGCTLWLIYGFVKRDDMIVNCNIVGTFLNSFYVLVFLRFTGPAGRMVLYRHLLLSMLMISMTLYYVWGNESLNVGDTLGNICILSTILSCASPLVNIRLVIRSKSTSSLPFPLILSIFLVCSQWWAYGILAGDFYMQFTNLIGTCISLAQLSLFCFLSN